MPDQRAGHSTEGAIVYAHARQGLCPRLQRNALAGTPPASATVKAILAGAALLPLGATLLIGAGMSAYPTPEPAAPVTTRSGQTPPPQRVGAFTGRSAGCTVVDPTGTRGCVTPATAWMYDQVQYTFGQSPAACWDAHVWNPNSDHPKGRACDFTIGRSGHFPDAADAARGTALAEWLRTNADALQVSYVIWSGQIWSASRAQQGWRTYTGGGVYDPHDPTGGHFDHVHVSIRG